MNPFNIADVRLLIKTNDTIIPTIGVQKSNDNFIIKRTRLFQAGVYPGVDYTVLQILKNGSTVNDTYLTLKPNYKLRDTLEREWPVSIRVNEIPVILTKGMVSGTLIVT